MFCIVEFLETNEVAVVPTNWKNDSICAWPPVKAPTKLNRLVEQRAEPQESWTMYNIRTFATFDNYSAARMALPKAELQSDLQSEAENEKRTVSRPSRYQDSICDASSDETDVEDCLLPRAPLIIPDSQTSTSQSILSPHNKSNKRNSFNTPKVNTHSKIKKKPTTSSSLQLSLNTQFLEEPFSQPQPVNNLATDITTTVNNATENSHSCSCNKLLMKTLRNIENTQKSHTQALQEMSRLVQQFVQNSDTTSRLPVNLSLPENLPISLPVMNIQDLNNFEEYLMETDNFSYMVNYLASFGGEGAKRILFRLLPELLSKEVSLQLNWKGRGENHSFQTYKLINGLIFRKWNLQLLQLSPKNI